MNHKEILKDAIGSRIDFDGSYGYQCVDWIKGYSKRRGRKITTSGNAFELWNKGLGKDWKKIVKTPLNYPSEGDVVIWGTSWGGGYGHIAICNRFCNTLVLRTVDQNGGDGSGNGLGKNAILPFFRSYKGVVGWFHYIG